MRRDRVTGTVPMPGKDMARQDVYSQEMTLSPTRTRSDTYIIQIESGRFYQMLLKRRWSVLLVLTAVALLGTACLPASILVAPIRVAREIFAEPSTTPEPSAAPNQPVVIQVPVPSSGGTQSDGESETLATGERGTLVELYRRLVPSVVSVQVIQRGPNDQLSGGAGSGFFYDYQGHIVTNAHVIRDAYTVDVVLYDETIVPAEVIGTDDDSDLAVLRVDLTAGNLPEDAPTPLPLADSDAVLPGQEVIAIGNPFGRQSSMTYGIISAVGRTIGSLTPFSIPQAIQTDAAINPGNSGGPLLSLSGEVIGVNAQIESAVRANAGVGFAIPSNIVARVVPVLIAEGQFQWPWLGVTGGDMTPRLAEANDLPLNTRGAYISGVTSSGPAEEAGLRGTSGEAELNDLPLPTGGDVIVALNGEPVRDMDDLILLISQQDPGDRATLTVLRSGERIEIQATLAARPDDPTG
jgi:S1-C subfamily serine protease